MHHQAITTAFLLQVKNVRVETVLKGDSAHGHLYSKPESERSQRSYVLSRDPKVFPFGVSFVDKGTHHSSFVSTHVNIHLSASQFFQDKCFKC